MAVGFGERVRGEEREQVGYVVGPVVTAALYSYVYIAPTIRLNRSQENCTLNGDE